MANQIARITKVTLGGRKSVKRNCPVLSCVIEFQVGTVLCKKDITDTLSIRFNGYLPVDFIEQELPSLVANRDFTVREGQGIQPYIPTSEIYDFISLEIKRKWREGGMEKWNKKKNRTCA